MTRPTTPLAEQAGRPMGGRSEPPGPGKAPCGSCPYRRDVPAGIWEAHEYAKLPGYDGETFGTNRWSDLMSSTYPPESEWAPRIFFREGHFYMIPLPVDDDLNEHARLNPGTLRIEDILGNVLWPEGAKQ